MVVPKPGSKIRICADFKQTVNPLYKLQGGQTFSKIDLSDAYLQIPVDSESRQFLVVNTPLGLFEYQRLPFGISSAPAIFQKFIQQLISDIPCTANYLDDIVVTGKTEVEHRKNLEALLYKLEQAGLTCNVSKCYFMKEKIKYLGNILTRRGIEPSNTGVEAYRK